ncbi:hypothetical protein K1X84_05695 [bacterium]|nr:hypothetical protein [bacterium]
MNEELFIFPALLALAGWISWLWFRKYRLSADENMKQLEIKHEMIKKFSTYQEFIEFLKSSDGKKIFPDHQSNAELKILRLLSAAVILILAGIAMLINGYSWSGYEDVNQINKMHDFYYWGSMAIAIGLGLLINAVIAKKFLQK